MRMDPQLLYARLPQAYVGYVISFGGSAKTEKHGGYGSCAWILWRLPEWTVVIAASAYLETTAVNMAEYTGMNNGVAAALAHGAENPGIVGDSRLAIQQSVGVIACRKESLMAQLNRHKDLTAKLRSVKYLHAIREFNAAADSLAGETLESKVSTVVESEDRNHELRVLNRIQEVIYKPSAETSEEVVTRSINSIRILETRDKSRCKIFFDFARETGQVSAVTRHQAMARQKHVRFATEPVIANQDTEVQDRTDNQVEETPDPQDPPGPDATSIHEPSADDIDPLAVQGERCGRISKAQDEELRWSNLKAVLKGEEAQLGYRAAREAWKMTDKFVLSKDGLLYFLGANRRWGRERTEETTLRLVVPTTMVQRILQNCHDSLEGRHQGIVRTYHRVKADYYWIGLFADVEKHVRSCPDCSCSKSRPHLRGYSPGNILAERPFQMVSMDFVIPLPKTRRRNTALLLSQCVFTGFVMGKAMADTSALRVAQAFEECVYRRFGAPSLIRHDRDPRFMSEVFQAFAEMMQSRSRATLSYRPQTNGQQERSVKTVIQSVRVYAEDPLQQDWDEIVEKLIFAINNSHDSTRKDTPFYLVHGWDARSTLPAMSSSLKQGFGRQSDALAWGREANRQQKIALGMAKEYQATEQARRAQKHNESLSQAERTTVAEPKRTANPVTVDEPEEPDGIEEGSPDEDTQSLFRPGDRAWLYMKRVKRGRTKKLAHRWHGPFRIKKKVDEYAFELDLPDRSGYRFYPVVHASRLKAVSEFGERPRTRLAPDVTEETRHDFDEELLPEDSWQPDRLAGEYEV
ncbi:hypothetical protein PF005_g7576 [Phytophthora fragariae]|uniref:Integrase catalytic domain-containing protein n=1 Tax=Phytophthora fragariae TaxID=53985 RepID=A0A6A3UC84_9STRA|nr:hypothetical protein PF003_g29447 [Phytophthora fragariae]KAE8942075.1 hypothetical protein PF009_g8151 [Phytophthora fragariae]KAE9121688.1 hypothetical protein PF007_g7734 [Phytophthora fragariae]KAE9148944.1 hypothetical protein PF006_g6522 [Phytophthora fragariae]KAE9220201.1 hypothetical protein PF005_g7576 [Phytophthora fragariae]